MKQSAGKRFAAAALMISVLWTLAACESNSEPEKTAPGAAARATVPPAEPPVAETPAAKEEPTLRVIEGNLVEGEMQFEDDLVLLGEGSPDWGEAPLTVHFTVESLITDQMNGPKYTWSFGDGSTDSNEAAPVHTYEKPGNYAVTVKVVDATGETGWDELDIEVIAPKGGAAAEGKP